MESPIPVVAQGPMLLPDEKLAEATDQSWMEVPCQRSVAGAGFSQGVQDYVFSIARPSAWIPSQSYFRVEVEILGAGDPAAATQPLLGEQLAYAENAVGNAYTNCYVRAGGQDISSITQFSPQASMLAARTARSGCWQHTVGMSAWGLKGSFAERCAAVSSSGANAAPVGLSGMGDGREIMYKPTTAGVGEFVGSTVAIDAAGAATGANTTFAATDVGSLLVVGGKRFTISAVADALNATVTPGAVGGIAATADWYMVRRQLVRSAEGRNRVQVLWCPPTGIFEYEGVLGSGDYRIQLSPDANFQRSMAETINPQPRAGAVGVADSTFTINVLDVRFYAAVAKMPIPDQVQTLHLREWSVQAKQMQSSNQNFSFSVPASTTRLHVFLQDGRAGSTPLAPPSRFSVQNGSDLNLQSLQLTYDNQVRPTTRWSTAFADNQPAGRNTAFLQQFYYQSLLERHAEDSAGGAETFNEWLERGPLYSFGFLRDASSRSTDVQLQISYNDPGVDAAAPGFDVTSRVFLVSEYDRTVEITTQGGSVTEVRSLSV